MSFTKSNSNTITSITQDQNLLTLEKNRLSEVAGLNDAMYAAITRYLE